MEYKFNCSICKSELKWGDSSWTYDSEGKSIQNLACIECGQTYQRETPKPIKK